MDNPEPIIRPNANGTPAVHGGRITVYNLMDHYLARREPALTAGFYPSITVEDVRAAYAYIADHEAELRPRYERFLERERQGNPPEVEARFAKSHEKLMRLKAELERKKAEAHARAAG